VLYDLWFASRGGGRKYSPKHFRLALRPTQAPPQWISGFPTPWTSGRSVKVSTHHHLVAKFRMNINYTPTSLHAFMGCQDNFALILYLCYFLRAYEIRHLKYFTVCLQKTKLSRHLYAGRHYFTFYENITMKNYIFKRILHHSRISHGTTSTLFYIPPQKNLCAASYHH